MPSYVITGASRGIGFEFTRQLSADLKNVVFALVRNKSTSKQLYELKRKNIHILEADITDKKALINAAQAVSKITNGTLDFLINNAAWTNDQRQNLTLDAYEDQDLLEEDLIKSFTINVVGVVHTINAFLPLLHKGEVKKVITLSSGAADVEATLQLGFAANAAYSISKAALNMAVAKYATQYKKDGFVFLALSPGLVNTSGGPLPEEVNKAQIALFSQIKPDFEGAITPEESVKLQLEVINKWTVVDTGAFVSLHGNKEWL
ncbi:hypothetical protein BDQ12DRAFT_349623 [Crucibulum laeve]|uniref:NAD(P)-binding protein n=1 Tax=Crucibulum laeve TaxID=68775 RepID=A0A5C3MB52_9AGAR|nr:hypothetical protein BDQ12DRAFT_349623 [Crucibulum laeve]